MTDKDNWQEKPGEGASSARRDGDRNSRNSSSDSNTWKKPTDRRTQGESFDRPRKSFGDSSTGGNRGGNSYDKPRSFGDNNDRPRRSFGDNNDRPRRPFGDNNDRPSRPSGDQGNSFSGNRGGGNSFDRPRRTFGEGETTRPHRSAGEEGNRFGGNREGNNNDRPRRTFGEGNDRPRPSFGENNDRPRRTFGDNNDRPRRPFGEGNDRPRPSFGEGNDRPRRNFSEGGGNRFGGASREGGNREGNSFDRPRPSFGENNDRPRRDFNEGNSFDKPRRSYGEGGNSFGGGNREGNTFDRPRPSFGENNDRPRRSFNEGGDRPRRPFGEDGGYKPRPTFAGGPSIPKPDRADGRPRRPRIKNESTFNHGTPYGSKGSAPKYQVSLDPDMPLRLNKFLANAGICSRREADEFIQAGVVKVNGEVVTELGVKVKPVDTILFHDQPVSIEHKVYILLNKPKDCVTTSDDPQERLTVMDLVKGACYERIYPVGRLDRNTTGVLLLTNDGDLASKLTHPKYEKRKIYQVTLDKDITAADIQTVLDGITLDDCEVKADNLSYVDADSKAILGIEIHSGQNRVVRRIFESLGYKVHKLDRVYFAGLTKKNLPRGKWRHLSEKEVNLLKMGAFV